MHNSTLAPHTPSHTVTHTATSNMPTTTPATTPRPPIPISDTELTAAMSARLRKQIKKAWTKKDAMRYADLLEQAIYFKIRRANLRAAIDGAFLIPGFAKDVMAAQIMRRDQAERDAAFVDWSFDDGAEYESIWNRVWEEMMCAVICHGNAEDVPHVEPKSWSSRLVGVEAEGE